MSNMEGKRQRTSVAGWVQVANSGKQVSIEAQQHISSPQQQQLYFKKLAGKPGKFWLVNNKPSMTVYLKMCLSPGLCLFWSVSWLLVGVMDRRSWSKVRNPLLTPSGGNNSPHRLPSGKICFGNIRGEVAGPSTNRAYYSKSKLTPWFGPIHFTSFTSNESQVPFLQTFLHHKMVLSWSVPPINQFSILLFVQGDFWPDHHPEVL